ncbi:uncharacterized protein LOC144922621 [Branchiostoma floridae x Branchiostoma belcheri]
MSSLSDSQQGEVTSSSLDPGRGEPSFGQTDDPFTKSSALRYQQDSEDIIDEDNDNKDIDEDMDKEDINDEDIDDKNIDDEDIDAQDIDDEDINYENIATESGAAPEIASDTAGINDDVPPSAYKYQDYTTCVETSSEETAVTKISCGGKKTSSSRSDDVLDQPVRCGSANNGNAQNIRHQPNVLYPQTTCLQKDKIQNQLYTEMPFNPVSTNIEDPNLMYVENTLKCNPVYPPNVRNPNPMYVQNPELQVPEADIAATPSEIMEDVTSDTASRNPANGTAQTSSASRSTSRTGPHIETEESACRQEDIGDSFDIKPYAVRNQTYGDNTATKTNGTGNEQPQDISPANVDIEPYAVRYGEDDDVPKNGDATGIEQTRGISPGNADIEPYAVAYMGQEDVVSHRTNDSSTISAGCSSSMGAANASVNRDVRDGRHQPPVCVANGAQQHICGWKRWECFAILIILLVTGGGLIGVFMTTDKQDTPMVTFLLIFCYGSQCFVHLAWYPHYSSSSNAFSCQIFAVEGTRGENRK